ncbi:EAL domain-containing protein [Parashewanella curva]|uniref:EAL domain-containing protein n=1 Tax=Parashewanella curva TaxID=2338552 RepID=A0A3L8PXW2_9GAMM|nr:EAL domain-containing protein [Parashewanella curva]RLV60297.1 EAL domain-containing protein [Parashewanella curva]
MTLFRQIYALLFGLFLLVVLCLGYLQFTETRSFLQKQMSSDINNASHSLGLMLVPALEAGDMAQAETLVNVIFEGGFYKQVKLTWLVDGKEQLWENPLQVQEVPQWFLALDLFPAITKESTVTSGWLQLAKLEITAHPAFGYYELWRVITNAIIIFALLFLVAIVCARYGITFLLKPLNALADHAKKLEQQQFGQCMDSPKIQELQPVVSAFNSMSTKLSKVFDSLDNELTQLRNKNLVDHVSGLPNRQYMMSRLESWTAEPGSGALILAKFEWLEHVHNRYGYEVRDETIRILSETLQSELDKVSSSVIARIAAFEFAFMIPDVEHERLSKYLQTLIRTCNQEITRSGGNANQGIVFGVAERLEDMNASKLLSQADNALQTATQQETVYVWLESSEPQSLDRQQWRDSLTSVIEAKQFHFRWQPVLSMSGQLELHRELYCQLEIQNAVINAGKFMPYVELFALGSTLDKCLLSSISSNPLLHNHSGKLAVNLTKQSIQDDDFHVWLDDFLASCSMVDKLCFEIPEAAVHSNLDACERLCQLLKTRGCAVGIDHYGRQLGSMSYLQTLNPNYVKLDQGLASDLEQTDNTEVVTALINVAKGLEIKIIVTGIQQSIELEKLTGYELEGYQGFIEPPVKL